MNRVLQVVLITLSLSFGSCESDFNINAPYQDVYILNCILRNDKAIQYALISKNGFTTNGTTPASNSIERNIKGVNVQVYYNDSVFIMRDTSIQVSVGGNATPVNCYYTKDLILSPGKSIRIEATVPDGTRLKSTIQIPTIDYTKVSPSFPQVNKSMYYVRPTYTWSWIGDTEESITILDLPQLEVYYEKYEQGAFVDKTVLIPMNSYYMLDVYGNPIPVPSTLSFGTFCLTTLETVNKTMQDISADDPNKENYIINKVVFSVICLDPELTKYYSANNTYSEDFTVKLRQTDFSNIEGGKGIFGVCYTFAKPLAVDSLYIRSFGYQFDPSRR